MAPKRNKSAAAKAKANKPKAPPVHPRVKAITKHFRAHVATVRKLLATDDEARDVVESLARFQARVPILESCRWDERKLGALQGLDDGVALQLKVKHQEEAQRLVEHLRAHTIPELNQAADALVDHVEDCKELLPDHPDATPCEPWDPEKAHGSNPVSPCELIAWMEELKTAFVDEVWRKETLCDNAFRCVWEETDDDEAAKTAQAVARLWPRTSPESFVDGEFLEIVLTNHDMIIP